MSKTVLITLNALKNNRGSEALVRGLIRICKEYDSSMRIVLSAGTDHETLALEQVDKIVPRIHLGKGIERFYILFLKKVLHKMDKVEQIYYKDLVTEAKKADYIFVVGADNYDCSYGLAPKMKKANDLLLKAAKGKTILYDCSLAERDLLPEVIEDMKRFDLITYRESETEKNLKKHINPQKLSYYPDPAFAMLPETWELPKVFETEKCIGINLSSLVVSTKYTQDESLVIRNFENLIDYIIRTTNYHIVLFPHVMDDKDLSVLRKIYRSFKQNERVTLFENEALNAAQLKYMIARFKMVITARTHASIAAYSSLVPTLVIGYSVKSVGIAKDLFGKSEQFVLPIEKITEEDTIVSSFKWLEASSGRIKKQLQERIPDYINKTLSTSDILK